ncbi:unnamed protein product [Ectocarpus sp. 12 AP-2014]
MSSLATRIHYTTMSRFSRSSQRLNDGRRKLFSTLGKRTISGSFLPSSKSFSRQLAGHLLAFIKNVSVHAVVDVVATHLPSSAHPAYYWQRHKTVTTESHRLLTKQEQLPETKQTSYMKSTPTAVPGRHPLLDHYCRTVHHTPQKTVSTKVIPGNQTKSLSDKYDTTHTTQPQGFYHTFENGACLIPPPRKSMTR